MMRIIRRAFLSVTRRAGRSALLVLVMTACVALALSGLSVSAASREAARLAREKLGATVTLRLDAQKLMQAVRQGDTTVQSMSRTVPLEAAAQLAQLPQVKAFNYTSSTMAVSETLEPVAVDTTSTNTPQPQTLTPRQRQIIAAQGILGGRGFGGNANFVQPDFTVSGTRESALLQTFSAGTATITEGRALTAADVGQAVALVERQVIDANELALGDKIPLQSVDQSVTQEFTIVGIYETTSSPDLNVPVRLAFMNPVNTIYVPYDMTATLAPAPADGETATSEAGVGTVQYLLGDPSEIEAFRTAALATTAVDWNWYTLDANDARYEQMVGPIENVASSSKMVIIITAVAGGAILALLLLLSLRDRTREIGVLLALGEKKSVLAGQMIVEALMLVAVAFVFGSLAGGFIANGIGDSLLARELATTQRLAERGAAGAIMIMGSAGGQITGRVAPISALNIAPGLPELLQAGGVALLTLLAAVLLPVLTLLRLKPREILVRHE